jgi:hypothetical protein
MQRPFPKGQRAKLPVRVVAAMYITAVTAGQSQLSYSGVGIFNWYYIPVPLPRDIRAHPRGDHLELTPLIYNIPAPLFQARPLERFVYIPITTPVVSALENNYYYYYI